MSTTTAASPPSNTPGRPCSMASALQAVGEKWALLAVRELFLGNHRFDQIARNTGAPRDRLAARLKTLEAAGVIERVAYSQRPQRFEYRLTAAGKDLGPVLTTLRAWGDRWAIDGPSPITFSHGPDDHTVDPVLHCRSCGERLRNRDLTAHVHAGGWSQAGPIAS